MATRIAWWLNLDAQHELEAPQRYRCDAAMVARIRALAARMTTLLSAHDVLLNVGEAAPHPPTEYVASAFCPTPSALAALHARGYVYGSAPTLAVLTQVTRRSFAVQLGQTLEGAAYVTSLAELETMLQTPAPSGEWLLKRDYGFAGREQRRVRPGALDAATRSYALNSFSCGQGLQVEPYYTREADFAQHGHLGRDGKLWVGPVMRQRCDERGVWQESMRAEQGALSPSEAAELGEHLQKAGKALYAAGYFGPYGVDAFRYFTANGTRAFQPRSEVNARFSMGYPRELLEQALAQDIE